MYVKARVTHLSGICINSYIARRCKMLQLYTQMYAKLVDESKKKAVALIPNIT